ncbi:hypothetical protein PGT21_028528 [Puccinia graminis f. sp. tritici]|uniref:Uncharacterized protein n=1 Tax=Puccinia graminis f. sp. tritici TaxID=56615 RepID=A0A5B0S6G3_PUCGR|nr:hypothetical protein PGT21_028528 [Puccinia graminis f. sp. tritici]KAA1133005.1 hypothetical protein PGTUg99_021431 [Puccinia graminis f. sp. tritici]
MGNPSKEGTIPHLDNHKATHNNSNILNTLNNNQSSMVIAPPRGGLDSKAPPLS